MKKHEVDQAAIDKAVEHQKATDEKVQAKEATDGPATANPTVSLTAEKVGFTRTPGESPMNLKPGWSYADAVKEQAKNLGIPIDDSMTLEYVKWLIRMKASQ